MRQSSGRLMLRSARRPAASALSLSSVASAAARTSATPAATVAPRAPLGARTFFSFLSSNKKPSTSAKFETVPEPEPILSQNDLFHPLSQSPFEALREKGERIRTYSICPVSYEKHHETVHPKFECPGCGFPTHASEARYLEGKAEHDEVCPRLREVNEDEHDIRSGRRVSEFENLPGEQPYEQAVSLATWDSFFFTRGFVSINSARAIRHVSKLMTYPISVLAALHQNGPFTASNGRITTEGRRSMAALHSVLHLPPGSTVENNDIRPMAPFRIFLLGARAESTLPAALWLQLAHLFPTTQFNIYFIGPEAGVPLVDGPKRFEHKMTAEGSKYDKPTVEVNVTPQLKLVSIQSAYEDVHNHFGPFDPYQDVFFAFSPGLGFPDQSLTDSTPAGEQPLVQAQTGWKRPLQQILATKCALFFTAFSPSDLARDVSALFGTQPPNANPDGPAEYPASVNLPTKPIPPIEGVSDEFELILTPGVNPFGSRKWEVAEWDVRVGVKTNWGIWGIRGKRYEVVTEEEGEEEE